MFIEHIFAMGLLIVSPIFELAGWKRAVYLNSGLCATAWLFLQRGEAGVQPFKIILLGCTWILSMIFSHHIRSQHLQDLKDIDTQVDQKKENITSLKITKEVLQEEIKVLDQTLVQKEALYDSLKELNKTLEFSRTVEVFSSLLSKLTSFQRGWILMLTPSDTLDHHPFCYQLFRDELPFPVNNKTQSLENLLAESEKEIFTQSIHSFAPIFIQHPQDDSRFKRMGELPVIESIFGIGLFHEGTPLGALILEGCEEREQEILQILAIQLSMEIEKNLLYEKVKNLSIMDGLTHMYQRRHLMVLLEDELTRLRSQEKTCSVLMADIDHFKGFNDNFGHLVGDILLKELSSALQDNLRPMDLVGRFGGEEFLIALPDTTLEEALQISERIRSDVQSRTFVIHEKLFKLTLSIGISRFPDDSENLSSLIEMADKALYEAKSAGRNQVRVYKKTGIEDLRENHPLN